MVVCHFVLTGLSAACTLPFKINRTGNEGKKSSVSPACFVINFNLNSDWLILNRHD